MILTVLILCCLLTALADLGDPTPDEIKKGFEVLPSKEWGAQARLQNSMRILCIGGSNTANSELNAGYVDLLHRDLKNGNIKSDPLFQNRSWALNNALSGMGPSAFIGRKYGFELGDTSLWPNIVIVDCSVNTAYPEPELEFRQLDSLYNSMVWKYHQRNLTAPDFMFYNMPHLKILYNEAPVLSTLEERETYIRSYPSLKWVFLADETIRQFSRRYGFPVISWGNATYDAAMRHDANSSSMTKPRWKYCMDGLHMTMPLGTTFGMVNLLRPLLKQAMTYRSDDTVVDLSIGVQRVMSPIPLQIEELSYFVEGRRSRWHELTEAIFNEGSTQWKILRPNHPSYCYGSVNASDVGEVRFVAPGECSGQGCRVQLTFLHSWNSSYVGNTSCSLHYHQHKGHVGVHLSTILINGQSECGTVTIPVKSEFAANVTEGLHSIKCINLFQGPMSCMIGVHVNTFVVI